MRNIFTNMFDLNYTLASEFQLNMFFRLVIKHWKRIQSSNAIMICGMTQRMHQIIWSSRIIQCDQNDYRIECHRMIWPCECESSNAIMICRMSQRSDESNDLIKSNNPMRSKWLQNWMPLNDLTMWMWIIECDHDLSYDSKDASNDLIKPNNPRRSNWLQNWMPSNDLNMWTI